MTSLLNHNRLGATFHRSFRLRRNQVQDVLRVAHEAEIQSDAKSLMRDSLRATTSIGTVQAQSAPRYAYGSGLLDEKNKLTLFGKLVYEHDPMLEKQATLWLMHYYLSSPHGFGPSYWYNIVSTRFRVNDTVNKGSLIEQITDHVSQTEERELDSRYAKSCANIFLGAYSDVEGLSSLGILRELESDTYIVEDPEPVPVWAFAVALLDFWQHQFPNRIALELEELYADGGLTSIFMIGAGRINRYLNTLQQAGMVDVYRVAPPYQAALLSPDPAFALDRLYTNEDDD
jgi:hypothetical protein